MKKVTVERYLYVFDQWESIKDTVRVLHGAIHRQAYSIRKFCSASPRGGPKKSIQTEFSIFCSFSTNNRIWQQKAISLKKIMWQKTLPRAGARKVDAFFQITAKFRHCEYYKGWKGSFSNRFIDFGGFQNKFWNYMNIITKLTIHVSLFSTIEKWTFFKVY